MDGSRMATPLKPVKGVSSPNKKERQVVGVSNRRTSTASQPEGSPLRRLTTRDGGQRSPSRQVVTREGAAQSPLPQSREGAEMSRPVLERASPSRVSTAATAPRTGSRLSRREPPALDTRDVGNAPGAVFPLESPKWSSQHLTINDQPVTIDERRNALDTFRTLARRIASTIEKQSQGFSKQDIDGSGRIELKEFQTMMSDANIKLPDRQLKILLTYVDADRNGDVDYGEFYQKVADVDNPWAVKAKSVPLGTRTTPIMEAAQSVHGAPYVGVLRNIRDKIQSRNLRLDLQLRECDQSGQGYVSLQDVRNKLQNMHFGLNQAELEFICGHGNRNEFVRIRDFMEAFKVPDFDCTYNPFQNGRALEAKHYRTHTQIPLGHRRDADKTFHTVSSTATSSEKQLFAPLPLPPVLPGSEMCDTYMWHSSGASLPSRPSLSPCATPECHTPDPTASNTPTLMPPSSIHIASGNAASATANRQRPELTRKTPTPKGHVPCAHGAEALSVPSTPGSPAGRPPLTPLARTPSRTGAPDSPLPRPSPSRHGGPDPALPRPSPSRQGGADPRASPSRGTEAPPSPAPRSTAQSPAGTQPPTPAYRFRPSDHAHTPMSSRPSTTSPCSPARTPTLAALATGSWRAPSPTLSRRGSTGTLGGQVDDFSAARGPPPPPTGTPPLSPLLHPALAPLPSPVAPATTPADSPAATGRDQASYSRSPSRRSQTRQSSRSRSRSVPLEQRRDEAPQSPLARQASQASQRSLDQGSRPSTTLGAWPRSRGFDHRTLEDTASPASSSRSGLIPAVATVDYDCPERTSWLGEGGGPKGGTAWHGTDWRGDRWGGGGYTKTLPRSPEGIMTANNCIPPTPASDQGGLGIPKQSVGKLVNTFRSDNVTGSVGSPSFIPEATRLRKETLVTIAHATPDERRAGKIQRRRRAFGRQMEIARETEEVESWKAQRHAEGMMRQRLRFLESLPKERLVM